MALSGVRGCAAGAACLLALAQSVAAQSISYEKYVLDNGMVVILHEDHTLPVVTVNTWYRVGSQDEPPGRSGFAHLFEHLMFMGTRRVPGNGFDVIMETGGGANNASTDFHRTNYFSWGPASLLPTLLWLDADRLEDMGLNMTQDKLDLQRDVVRNELRQVIENRPYGKAEDFLYQLMYPPGHPYHYSVAGTHEDLENATLTNVKDFFANFYLPNNASLVVAGDFDPAAAKPLIAALFGTLPRGPDVQRRAVEPVQLSSVVRFTMLDKVQLPKVLFVYHSPRAYQPGDAELAIAARVLTDGKNSRLYKRLVYDDQVAVEVRAHQYGYPLGGQFMIDVLAKPDADLAGIETAVDEEIGRLSQAGPTNAELERHKASIELEFLAELQELGRVADRLNEYEYFYGEPGSFRRDLDRYRNATADAVQKAAKDVLTSDARLIMRVLPEEPQRRPSPRDQRPEDVAAGTFTPEDPRAFELSNGLRVLFWRRSELPLVALRLVATPGGALDSPEHVGLAALTAKMMAEGSGQLDALAFSDALRSLGATFAASAERETAAATMTVLSRNLAPAAQLFGDAVARPRLEEEDWRRTKALHVDELRQEDDEPTAVAGRVAERLLFGERNPYGRPVGGTRLTVEGIELEHVRAAHARLFCPGRATLLVAGDVAEQALRDALEQGLGAWKSPGRPAESARFEVPEHDGLRVAVVDRPGAVQTVIRFEMPGVALKSAERVPLRLLNTLLGGSFTSRLNQNLREKHGYTYGARSAFEMGPSLGAFVARASVKAEVTGAALREFMRELERVRGGDISVDEAAKARNTLRNDTVQSLGGLSGFLSAVGEPLAAGLALDTVAADLQAIDAVSAADLNALARTAIPLERAVLVLVGDKGLIQEQLKDLRLPPAQEHDAYGVPLRGPAGASPRR